MTGFNDECNLVNITIDKSTKSGVKTYVEFKAITI